MFFDSDNSPKIMPAEYDLNTLVIDLCKHAPADMAAALQDEIIYRVQEYQNDDDMRDEKDLVCQVLVDMMWYEINRPQLGAIAVGWRNWINVCQHLHDIISG